MRIPPKKRCFRQAGNENKNKNKTSDKVMFVGEERLAKCAEF